MSQNKKNFSNLNKQSICSETMYSLHSEDVSFILNASTGGSIRNLCVGKSQLLAFSEDVLGKAWIYPWRGGIFTLVVEGVKEFRLPPWGTFPGFVGFNSVPSVIRKNQSSICRSGETKNIHESTCFEAVTSGLRILSEVRNFNVSDQERPVTYAIFLFLNNRSDKFKITSDEGDVVSSSRRSFEVISKTRVSIIFDEYKYIVKGDGNGDVVAFNLGDEGVHVMMLWNSQLNENDVLNFEAFLELRSN